MLTASARLIALVASLASALALAAPVTFDFEGGLPDDLGITRFASGHLGSSTQRFARWTAPRHSIPLLPRDPVAVWVTIRGRLDAGGPIPASISEEADPLNQLLERSGNTFDHPAIKGEETWQDT